MRDDVHDGDVAGGFGLAHVLAHQRRSVEKKSENVVIERERKGSGDFWEWRVINECLIGRLTDWYCIEKKGNLVGLPSLSFLPHFLFYFPFLPLMFFHYISSYQGGTDY